MSLQEKRLRFVGSSREDLKSFPKPVMTDIGFALRTAQQGGKAQNAKPLKGFHGASTLEVVSNFDGDTFRAVYTVRFEEAVYVLHCFQKKSKSGIATPKHELETVKARLKQATEAHAQWQREHRESQ